MAGAAKDLHEAITINPYDLTQTAEAIHEALIMSIDEQQRRMREMQLSLQRYDVKNWVAMFLGKLKEVHFRQKELSMKALTIHSIKQMVKKYEEAESRKLFLDYDGTLVPIRSKPEFASPDETLIVLLKRLASDPKNKIVIISGRDRDSMEKWFKDLPEIDLIAEHGFLDKKEKRILDIYLKCYRRVENKTEADFRNFCKQNSRSFCGRKKQ